MSNNPSITKFEKLVKDLNTIIFGDDDQDVILDDIVKPTISKWLRSIVKDLNDVIDIAAAAGAGANGWTAQLVVDESGKTQQEINNNQAILNSSLESIAAMIAIANPKNGMRVYVKSYHAGLRKGGGYFVYDSTKASTNDTGVVINGWVRQLEAPPNPYHFGAYGDWNASAQTGHDDSVPFQKCIDYILANYTDFRGSKSGRQLTLEIGSYLVGGLQFKGSGWSFRMVGQGMYTQLWHKKELGRHVVNLEHTHFENIFFNGAAKPAAEPEDAVDYVFDFYLLNEALDIDTQFNNCAFSNFNTFARVDGRGFKTTNSMLGGGKGALLEIYCDPNALYPAGNYDSAMRAYHSGMRHYVIDRLRVDSSPLLVKITGTGQQIDYINGLTISNCEITNCYNLIYAPTATLVEPKIINNFGILCFSSIRTYAAVVAKSIVDGIDSGNQWAVSKYRGEVPTDRARCLAAMYRAETIDGLTLNTNVYKDLYLGVVRFTEKCNNLKIVDSTFDNFALSNNEKFVWNESNDHTKATNILIDGNTITSTTTGHVWVNNITGSSSFKAVNNTYPANFADQRIPYNPDFLVNGAVASGVIQEFNRSYYEIDGDYINVYIVKGVRSTPASGNIAYSLPVPAIAENMGISAYYSGSGQVDLIQTFAQGSYSFLVNASSDQRANIRLNGANLNLSSKTGDRIQIIGSFRYRFK